MRRYLASTPCHFCGQRLYRIGPDGPLYCYGCREQKDELGTGHKDDLAQGLLLGERPSDVTLDVRRTRLKELADAKAAKLLPPLDPL